MTNLPVTGEFTITACYNQTGKYWKNGHKGIDFVSPDRNVYSTCDGVVRVTAYDENGWGRYVSIGDSEGNRHIFCHLSSCKVSVGQKVSRETVLGIMGQTGNASGVHLHYELHDSGNNVIDPTLYLGIPNAKGVYNSKDYQLGGEKMNYKDKDSISIWAKDSVQKVTDAGIMLGDERGYFNPKSFLTREQAAVIITRLLERK